MMQLLETIKDQILNLLAPEPDICLLCRRHYEAEGLPTCLQCLQQLGIIWQRLPTAERCFSLGLDQGYLRQLLQDLKFNGQTQFGVVLGSLLGLGAREEPEIADAKYILPMPMNSQIFAERGFNHSDILAEGIMRVWNIPRARGFVTVKHTAVKSGLSSAKRQQKIVEAFAVNNPPNFRGQKVVIIDDIYTTGSKFTALADLVRACRGSPCGLFVATGF